MEQKFSPSVDRPLTMLKYCPAYETTPILEIKSAGSFRILVKDETERMGLGSFKALGGIYAVAQFLIQKWFEEKKSRLSPDQLTNKSIEAWTSAVTFVCASAGNHGIAVAKGAQLFSAKCRVHLSQSVPKDFELRLVSLGAEIVKSGTTYEESVEIAKQDAIKSSSVLLSDSSWPGYLHLPALIMEGYTVMAEEMRAKFAKNGNWPTHVFLQAGVGGIAAALTFEIRDKWAQQPKVIVVEPAAAPCLHASIQQGKITTVTGPVSVMGRLDCKQPSLIAFNVLKELADKFVVIGEDDAEQAKDYFREQNLETTTSGAAGLAAVLKHEELDITLSASDKVLVIATEGSFT